MPIAPPPTPEGPLEPFRHRRRVLTAPQVRLAVPAPPQMRPGHTPHPRHTNVGKSGWHLLIPFYVFYLIFAEGQRFDNKYGPKIK